MNDDDLGCHMCRLSVIQPYDRADWRCAGLYIHTYPEGGSIKRIDSQKAHGELFPMNLAPSKHPWWTGVLLLLASTGLVPSAPAQDLKVTLLGTGSPGPRMDRFGPRRQALAPRPPPFVPLPSASTPPIISASLCCPRHDALRSIFWMLRRPFFTGLACMLS